MKLPGLGRIFKKTSPQYVVIDIGSSRVKVAICRGKDQLKERETLGVGIKLQSKGSIYAGKILNLDSVIETTGLALDEATIKSGVTANRAVIGLSGGVMVPRSYRVRVKRQKPDEKMTVEEFTLLAKQIEEQTLKKALEEGRVGAQDEIMRVETVFTSYMVDGATVVTPVALTGAEVEVTVLHYLMENNRVRAINSLVDQLGLEVVSMVDTTIFAAVKWIETYGDYVLVDIGGDVTELVVVERGKITENLSVFIGGYDITQAIETSQAVPFDAAENLKIAYSQGQLDEVRGQQVHQVVGEVTDYIVEGVAAMVAGSKPTQLPPHFVISGESRHLHEVKTAFASYPWMHEGKFSVFPKIEEVQGKDPVFEALTQIEL